jgi:outer membrane biosynthesis protein TonB
MGIVQVHFEPLELPGIGPLPVRAIHEYLTIDMSAGQVATQSSADVIGDIFVPYYSFFQVFRPGHDFVLPAGSTFRAETAAAVDARDANAVTIATPPPIVTNFDPPHSDFRPPPIYTMIPTPSPKPKPTRRPPTPSPEPTDSPTPSPSPTPKASPAPASTASPQAAPPIFVPGPGATLPPSAPTSSPAPSP